MSKKKKVEPTAVETPKYWRVVEASFSPSLRQCAEKLERELNRMVVEGRSIDMNIIPGKGVLVMGFRRDPPETAPEAATTEPQPTGDKEEGTRLSPTTEALVGPLVETMYQMPPMMPKFERAKHLEVLFERVTKNVTVADLHVAAKECEAWRMNHRRLHPSCDGPLDDILEQIITMVLSKARMQLQ